MRVCEIDACQRQHKARGMCGVHYERFKKYGDPHVNLLPNRRPQWNAVAACSVESCERDRYAAGMCRLHYKRLQKFGTTEAPARANPRCSVDGCERTCRHATGLCALHRGRLARTGRLAPVTDEERFWQRVDQRGPNECWEIQGSRHPKGHAYATRNGRNVYAHRFSLELALGRPLREGTMACHHCDNPPCVNPAHLYEGDAQSNVDDMWRRGRANPGSGRRRRADLAAADGAA